MYVLGFWSRFSVVLRYCYVMYWFLTLFFRFGITSCDDACSRCSDIWTTSEQQPSTTSTHGYWVRQTIKPSASGTGSHGEMSRWHVQVQDCRISVTHHVMFLAGRAWVWSRVTATTSCARSFIRAKTWLCRRLLTRVCACGTFQVSPLHLPCVQLSPNMC